MMTPHGTVETPAFMTIATAGAVKGVTVGQLETLGCPIILANTYHLHLRPGAEAVERLGGLHRFMGWGGPILTDSGGYQVFSLAELNRIDDDGVTFRSHVDGQQLRLDPERATAIQNQLGGDVIMAFDQCVELPADRGRLAEAVERTLRWARRCRAAHRRDGQALFGIDQGGLDADLRRRCLDGLLEIGFDGYAVGGLSVGERRDEMLGVLDGLAPHLPVERPRYLMGVGMPHDIAAAVARGIDLFDCVLPTRNGRNAFAFTDGGAVRLRNARYRLDERPLEPGCECPTCRRHTRAYLRHLFGTREMLGPVLVSVHNIAYYQRLMARIRRAVDEGRLARLVEDLQRTWRAGPAADEDDE